MCIAFRVFREEMRGEGRSRLPSLSVLKQDSGGDSAELVAAIEAGDLENKHEAKDLALELSNEVRGRLGRTTSGNDVVDHQDVLALLDGIILHLEKILAVLLDVLGGNAGTGQLALLANGSEGDAEAQGQTGAEEEAAGIQTDNDIGLGGGEGLGDLEGEGVEKSGVGDRIREEGHDIDKVDASDGEILEVAEVLAQNYLCTGELGGTGGGGGGLSVRGGILRVGGGDVA
jgi:hypothetical protein